MGELPPQTTKRGFALRAGAIALALTAAVGVALWLAHDGSQLQPSLAVDVILTPPSPPAFEAAAPASAGETASASFQAETEGEVQLCGGGWVRIDGPQGEDLLAKAADDKLKIVLQPTLSIMRSSLDERAQAAALYYEAALVRHRSHRSDQCKTVDECRQSVQAHMQVSEPNRDALALLAQSTSDPTVYAWAVAACGQARGAAACQLVSTAQWARLDPQNAVPWLVVAEEAREQGDTAAVDDAMFHVASAVRYDAGEARIASTLLDHVPAGEANLLGADWMAAEGITFSQADSSFEWPILQYCHAKLLEDPNRRDLCDRIANLAAERSTSLATRSLAFGIGKRLGWPSERFRTFDAGRRAFYSATAQRTMFEGSASCDWAQKQIARFREWGELGEADMAERVVAAAAKSPTVR